MMGSQIELQADENIDYSLLFSTQKPVMVVKKDGSLEVFNINKVVDAVGKSAYRALTKFTEDEKKKICLYVISKVEELENQQIPIPVMHNIVESALEEVKPIVAKSYRDYRNYKQDFVRMLDDVYKKVSLLCMLETKKMQIQILH